jgi:hypothetical protein
MSRFHAYYVQGIFFLMTLAAGAGLGLHLSRWHYIRTHLPLQNAPARLSVHFPATPDAAVTATWTELFNVAKKEIWLSAGRLESVAILRSLDEAKQRGVVVYLTLSVQDNPTPDAGARAWLRDKTSLRDVRISQSHFSGVACVVDGNYAIVTAQGLLAADANAQDGGIFLYATGAEVAGPLRTRLAAQYAEADPSTE